MYANECRATGRVARSNATSNNQSTTIQTMFNNRSNTFRTVYCPSHVWMRKNNHDWTGRLCVTHVCWTGRLNRSPLHFLRVGTERCATIIHGEKWPSLCSKTYSSTIVSAKNIHILDHTREIVQPLILKLFAGCYKISSLCYIESKPLNLQR